MQRQPEEKKRYYPTPCLCLREAIVAAHAEAHVRMHVILDTSSSFCSYQHAHTLTHTHTHSLSRWCACLDSGFEGREGAVQRADGNRDRGTVPRCLTRRKTTQLCVRACVCVCVCVRARARVCVFCLCLCLCLWLTIFFFPLSTFLFADVTFRRT